MTTPSVWRVEPDKPPAFDWDRSKTLALASHACPQCHGLGLRAGRGGKSGPCKCVLRAIFRACFHRYRHIVLCRARSGTMWPQIIWHGERRHVSWGRRNEEYTADFYLVAKRTLDQFEWSVFVGHFLLGGEWKTCCRHLRIDRGTFFHAVYRIEEKLGRVFRELRPYSLFPLDEYFQGTTRR
jgi:hypothetical protein